MSRILPIGTGLGIASLRIADLDRSISFYAGILGFAVLERSGESALLAAGTVPLLRLEAHHGIARRPSRATGLFHVAILLPTRSDLGTMLRRLAQMNISIGASDHIVSEALYLDDPDGNGLEIYCDRPRDTWRWNGSEIAMATAPMDLQSVMTEGAEPTEPYHLPDDTRIGHMHLQVGDLAAARHFYVDLLGMDVTTESYSGALFVSAGGYHHHIGLNTWHSRGMGAAPEDAAGLIAFELILPGKEQVAAVQTRLEQGGATVVNKASGFDAEDPWGNGIQVRAA